MVKKLRQEKKEQQDALERRSSLQGLKEQDDQGGHPGLGLPLGKKLLG